MVYTTNNADNAAVVLGFVEWYKVQTLVTFLYNALLALLLQIYRNFNNCFVCKVQCICTAAATAPLLSSIL